MRFCVVCHSRYDVSSAHMSTGDRKTDRLMDKQIDRKATRQTARQTEVGLQHIVGHDCFLVCRIRFCCNSFAKKQNSPL